MRTARQDCLDHILVVSRRHLEVVLVEYLRHYNQARPHRSLQLSQPVPRPELSIAGGEIARRKVLGGVIHEYERAA